MADTSANEDGLRVDILKALAPGKAIIRVTHEPTGITEVSDSVSAPITPVVRALQAKVRRRLQNRPDAAG